jgi:hypothetical protein
LRALSAPSGGLAEALQTSAGHHFGEQRVVKPICPKRFHAHNPARGAPLGLPSHLNGLILSRGIVTDFGIHAFVYPCEYLMLAVGLLAAK